MQNPKSSRRDNKKENKEKIIQATLDMVCEKGFHGVPMSQLARTAGVSVGTIYLYFENKNDLIIETFKIVKTQMSHEILDNLPKGELSVEQSFRLLCKNTINYYIGNKTAFMFIEQFMLSPFQHTIFDAFSDEVVNKVNSLIKRAIQEEIIIRMPVEVITSIVYGAMSSYIRKYHQGLIKVSEGSKHALVDSCWRAIKNDKSD